MSAEAKAQAATTVTTLNSPIPEPIFITPRLLIRPLHPQDAPSMSRHASNPAIAQYMSLSFPSPYTLESAHEWINMNLAPPIFNWGMCFLSNPAEIIGGIGLKPGGDVQSHTAEIGFWIGEAFWGRGYVTEALEGMTEWCFVKGEVKGRKLTRLSGVVFEGNKGSMRCFEKCGYVREGVLKGAVEKLGVVKDMHVFGLVKGDWKGRTNSGG